MVDGVAELGVLTPSAEGWSVAALAAIEIRPRGLLGRAADRPSDQFSDRCCP
jgi:hypothetical protein